MGEPDGLRPIFSIAEVFRRRKVGEPGPAHRRSRRFLSVPNIPGEETCMDHNMLCLA